MAALGGAPYSAALYPGAFPDRNDFILYYAQAGFSTSMIRRYKITTKNECEILADYALYIDVVDSLVEFMVIISVYDILLGLLVA